MRAENRRLARLAEHDFKNKMQDRDDVCLGKFKLLSAKLRETLATLNCLACTLLINGKRIIIALGLR